MDHLPGTEFLHRHFNPPGARVYLGSLLLSALLSSLATIYSIHTGHRLVQYLNELQAHFLGGQHLELLTFLAIILPLAFGSIVISWSLGRAANWIWRYRSRPLDYERELTSTGENR